MTDKAKQSTSDMTLIQRLIAIQRQLHAPKNQFNKFGNYRYRSAEDILNSVKPLLESYGILLTLSDALIVTDNDSQPAIITPAKNSSACYVPAQRRVYVEATARITDGRDIYETKGYAREDEVGKGMDGAQLTGSASSYARKYALNGLFLIDDSRDADATNTGDGNVKSVPTADRLADAIAKIQSCQSREQLAGLWATYVDLQANADFVQAISEVGKKFPKK